MKRPAISVLLVLLAVLLPAQDGPDAEEVLRVYGSLREDPATAGDGIARDELTFETPVSGTVTIVAVSVDFTPLLDVPGRPGRVVSGSEGSASLQVFVEAGEEVTVVVETTTTRVDHGDGRLDYILVATLGAGRVSDELALGTSVRGELSSSDERDVDGSYIDWYSVDLPPDSRVEVELWSFDLDTYLVVELPNGRELENDDHDGTDSRLEFTTGSGGVARVGATSFGYESTGSYTVSLSVVDAPGRTLRVDESVEGSLEDEEDEYLLVGEPGERVRVELRSSRFDTYLEVRDADGGYVYNDDAGDTSISRVVYALPESGEATLTVSSFGGDGGPYTLSVESVVSEVSPLPDGYRLRDGETVNGELSPNLPIWDGTPRQRFTFVSGDSERVTIELRSEEMDSYLTVVTPDGERLTDDDSAGDLNSRLQFVTRERGVYEVYASDLYGEEWGSFELSYENEGSVNVLLSTEGELAFTDSMDITGHYYDVYRFSVRRGEFISVQVRSDELDAYAVVRNAAGGILHRGDGDPLIEFTATASETLELVVTSYGPESTGRYVIAIFE